MAADGTFTQLARSFEDIGREFARLEAEHGESQTLIASAEYELDQIRKVLAGAVFDFDADVEADASIESMPAPEPAAPDAPPMSLVAKLRKRFDREESEPKPVLRLSA